MVLSGTGKGHSFAKKSFDKGRGKGSKRPATFDPYMPQQRYPRHGLHLSGGRGLRGTVVCVAGLSQVTT